METQERATNAGGETADAQPTGHVDHSRIHLILQNLYEVMETAPAVVMITDSEGVIQYVNPRFTQATGYTSEDVVGHSVREVAWDSPTHQEAWDTLASGHSWCGEIMFTRKDGGEYWAQAAINPIRSIDGQIQRFVGIHVEITDQKRIARELEERKAYWQALVDSAPNFIATLGRDGTITTVNRVIGGKASAVIGSSVYDYALPEFHDAWTEALKTVFEQRESTIIEVCGRHADGTTGWFALSVGPVVSGDTVTAAVCVALDLTERKAAEDALREREAYWRALVESAPAFIVTLDRDGTITSVNRELEGGKPNDAIGHTVFDFAVESAREDITSALSDVFEKGEIAQMENEAALTTGEMRSWAYTIGPVWDGDQVVAGILVSHDITERRQTEKRLRAREAQWRALLENAPDYILIVDEDATILRLNRGAGDIMPEEMVGHSALAYAAEEHHEDWLGGLRQVFTTGARLTIETRSRNMGRPRWFSSSIGPIYDGDRVTAAVVVARDVTERRQAEERLRAFATAVPDLIVVVDKDGQLLEILGENGHGLLTGSPAAAAIRGTHLHDHISAKQAEWALGFVRETISGGKPLEDEARFDLPSGQTWVHGSSAPLTLNDGRVVAVVHVSDITERKKLESELEELREEVETQAEARHEKGARFGLTFRELTVLALIARGCSDKEIAGLLGVSPFTVNKQSASAVRKLESRSRSEAVARAVRAGII